MITKKELHHLKQYGFTVGEDTTLYAAKEIRREQEDTDIITAAISVEQSGKIWISEQTFLDGTHLLTETVMLLGQVHSIEQFITIYNELNAINTTGGYEL